MQIKNLTKNSQETQDSEEFDDYLIKLNISLIRDYLKFRFGKKVSNKFATVTNRIREKVKNKKGQMVDLKQHILVTLKLIRKGCEQKKIAFPQIFYNIMVDEEKPMANRYEIAKKNYLKAK